MKKILMGLMGVALVATVASAGVGIQWSTANWGEDGSGGGIADGYDVIWQLIYAGADGIIQEIDGSMGEVSPAIAANRHVWGDDVVWGQRDIPSGGGVAVEWDNLVGARPGTEWNEWVQFVDGNTVYENLAWSTLGSVYQRVFMLPEGYEIFNGTQFYQTDLVVMNTEYAGGGAPTQGFYVDGTAGPFEPNRTVAMIPEPATMSLLGLGALALAIRRRRK